MNNTTPASTSGTNQRSDQSARLSDEAGWIDMSETGTASAAWIIPTRVRTSAK